MQMRADILIYQAQSRQLFAPFDYQYTGFFDKKDTDYQKVQVTDEIKRDTWKYLVFSDVADDT